MWFATFLLFLFFSHLILFPFFPRTLLYHLIFFFLFLCSVSIHAFHSVDTLAYFSIIGNKCNCIIWANHSNSIILCHIYFCVWPNNDNNRVCCRSWADLSWAMLRLNCGKRTVGQFEEQEMLSNEYENDFLLFPVFFLALFERSIHTFTLIRFKYMIYMFELYIYIHHFPLFSIKPFTSFALHSCSLHTIFYIHYNVQWTK